MISWMVPGSRLAGVLGKLMTSEPLRLGDSGWLSSENTYDTVMIMAPPGWLWGSVEEGEEVVALFGVVVEVDRVNTSMNRSNKSLTPPPAALGVAAVMEVAAGVVEVEVVASVSVDTAAGSELDRGSVAATGALPEVVVAVAVISAFTWATGTASPVVGVGSEAADVFVDREEVPAAEAPDGPLESPRSPS